MIWTWLASIDAIAKSTMLRATAGQIYILTVSPSIRQVLIRRGYTRFFQGKVWNAVSVPVGTPSLTANQSPESFAKVGRGVPTAPRIVSGSSELARWGHR